MEILWKGTASSYFRANRLKLCGNGAFPQNFHGMKLGKITVFFAVDIEPLDVHLIKSILGIVSFLHLTHKRNILTAVY